MEDNETIVQIIPNNDNALEAVYDIPLDEGGSIHQRVPIFAIGLTNTGRTVALVSMDNGEFCICNEYPNFERIEYGSGFRHTLIAV